MMTAVVGDPSFVGEEEARVIEVEVLKIRIIFGVFSARDSSI